MPPSPQTHDFLAHLANPHEMRRTSRSIKLRHNRRYPRGKSRAAFRFWKSDHNDCAGFGNLIEIREQLDLIMVRAHYPGWSLPALKYLYEGRKITASGHETTDTNPGIATTKDDYSLETYVLLNQGTARSQQVRITLNKFRPSQGNDDLSVPGADVTNTSFHRAITLVIEAAEKRYSHEGEEEKSN